MGAAPKLPADELLADFAWPRERVPAATRIRGGYLLSSLRSLRAAGHGDAYYATLRTDLRGQVAAIAASEWYPIELGAAHYGACDALGLPTSDIQNLGVESARHAFGAFVGVLAKLSTGAGATPFTLFAQAPRHWGKAFVGSSIASWKTGPKEARVEFVGLPFCGLRYVRVGMRGVLLGITEVFCKKAYAYDIPELCTHNTLGYRFAWV